MEVGIAHQLKIKPFAHVEVFGIQGVAGKVKGAVQVQCAYVLATGWHRLISRRCWG